MHIFKFIACLLVALIAVCPHLCPEHGHLFALASSDCQEQTPLGSPTQPQDEEKHGDCLCGGAVLSQKASPLHINFYTLLNGLELPVPNLIGNINHQSRSACSASQTDAFLPSGRHICDQICTLLI